MTGIFNGIQNLWSGIQTIVNGIMMGIQFLINLIKSLFEMVRIITTTMTNTNTLIMTLPPFLIAFATTTIGIAVLYLIIGRDTGKNK